MKHNTFHKDLRQGLAVEQHLRHLIETKRPGAITKDGPGNSAYDFEVIHPANGMIAWVEVKDESNYKHTGNVCIETCRTSMSEPSGIATTLADVMVHYFDDDNMFVHNVAKTQQALMAMGGRYFERRFSKTDVAAGGYIIPVDDFPVKNYNGNTYAMTNKKRLADDIVRIAYEYTRGQWTSALAEAVLATPIGEANSNLGEVVTRD